MFIQTEATPNPATLKFLPGETVVQNGPFEFVSAEEAAGQSPSYLMAKETPTRLSVRRHRWSVLQPV